MTVFQTLVDFEDSVPVRRSFKNLEMPDDVFSHAFIVMRYAKEKHFAL